MPSDNVVTITDANFEQEVLKSTVPVLVDFSTEWCPPCRQLAPTIDKLAADYSNRVKVGKLDTDNNYNSAVKYGIEHIPTVIVFKGGQITQKLVGLKAEKDLREALDATL